MPPLQSSWRHLRLLAWLVGLVVLALTETQFGLSADAAGYGARRYDTSIRQSSNRKKIRMRQTRHNSKGMRRFNNTRGGHRRSKHYRHGSIHKPGKYKSSGRYGPPRVYNPYSRK